MAREVRPLVRALSLRPVPATGVHRTWRGGDRLAAVVGIGPVAAERATHRLLDTFGVERVLVAGVAGAVDPALAIGDVVFPSEVLDRATGTVFRPHRPGGSGLLVTSNAIGGALADEGTPRGEVAPLVAEVPPGEVPPGEVPPGELPPGELPPGTSAVDMETAAIARVCEERGVPWAVVRTISDVPGTLDDSILELLRPDGGLDVAALARLLVREPRQAARLARFGRDVQRAVHALTMAALREL